jgi:hypothetical protein
LTGDTGASCAQEPPDPRVILNQATGVLNGTLSFDNTTTRAYFDTDCNLPAAAIFGTYITRGICLALNLLCLTGLYQYLQFGINTMTVVGVIQYARTRIVDYFLV